MTAPSTPAEPSLGGGSADRRWRQDLAGWAIPDAILASAPESPWTFPVELFARRADGSAAAPTFSTDRALEALPERGLVLDVGCGAGAASLPLAGRAGALIGVDTSDEMLEAFRERAARAAIPFTAVEGAWPACAAEVPLADVVVCHHVLYNAPGLRPFVLALTEHARARVVVELTLEHPQSGLNDLWLRFHGLARPERPTADDAVQVLREAGLRPERTDWTPEARGGFAEEGDLIAWIRRRLCLTPDRDAEVREALRNRIHRHEGSFGLLPRPVATLWWEGSG
jgi:SAM-dependent methyltransferase